ncbi:response regulator transcription factor [Desmospora profundinema]|uniref:DNA-binding response OmpR family regulator n=1 Tax=Desmospora profundinema TaxID=1571184 RepID=A0ABU1IQ34_9BACL|nr:response regulator transcription factor [Desmospora profundinema]MDR6226888.1 DNA-binding response OmpR family regulator [Desmospora profundinema]
MKKEKILLVDDERGLLQMLLTLLKREGFSHVDTATTAEEALHLVRRQPYDIILLDVMLPDMEGFEVCRQIRNHTLAPILFVTARSSDWDKLTGLGIGGDDYITKPFNPLELVARIQVQLRRTRLMKEDTTPLAGDSWDFGSFKLDRPSGQLIVKGEPVHCTAKELELLSFFCANPNRIFTAQQLYEYVWGPSFEGDEKTVVIHISKLRKKIEAEPKHPRILVNLRGIGYKFTPPQDGGDR